MDRKQFTFYRSFWEAVKRLKKADRLSALDAICAYALDGEEVAKTEAAEAIFILIKPVLDSASKKADGGKKSIRDKEDNDKITPSKKQDNGNEKEKEKEVEKEKEEEYECKKTPARAKATKKEFGVYGWVKLTDEEYEKLRVDLGLDELQRCITYVDESAQKSGNKNKWKDWNLVIRNCHRDGWGMTKSYTNPNRIYGGTQKGGPTEEEYQKMQKMLKEFDVDRDNDE